MPQWALMLGGLVIWAAHFFAIYIAASLFPGEAMARWLALILTIAAVFASAWVGGVAARARGMTLGKDPEHWIARLAMLGAGLAAVAVLYQGAAALIG